MKGVHTLAEVAIVIVIVKIWDTLMSGDREVASHDESDALQGYLSTIRSLPP